jgi:putative membrane protein insertion efficiency factor
MTSEALGRKLSPPSRFAVRFIETYRLRVAPRLGGHCRFEPTCSSYGLEAYERHGFWKASARTAWRLLRCNPWNKGPRLDPP